MKDILDEQTRTVYPPSEMRPCVEHDLSPLAPEATGKSKVLGLATKSLSQQILGEMTKRAYMVTPKGRKRVNAGPKKVVKMTHALRGWQPSWCPQRGRRDTPPQPPATP